MLLLIFGLQQADGAGDEVFEFGGIGVLGVLLAILFGTGQCGGKVGSFDPIAFAEDFGKLGDDRGQGERVADGVGACCDLGGVKASADFRDLIGVRVFVADGGCGELAGFFGPEFEFVEGGGCVACTDFAAVHGVVAEVLIGDVAVFITDEAIAADDVGIEVYLDFDITGDDLQGAG